MATTAAATATGIRPTRATVPVDSFYDLQRSLSGIDVLAYLTADAVNDKKPSRLTDVAFHAVRPWLAAIDPKGAGIVWNYETREVITEFSLDIAHEPGSDVPAGGDPPTGGDGTSSSAIASAGGSGSGGGDEDYGGAGTPTAAGGGRGLFSKSGASSPTKSYVMGASRIRNTTVSLRMLFFDHEAIAWTTKCMPAGRQFFEDWILVVTSTHIVLCDLNQPTSIRSIPAEDLQRQVPCSVEILPSGLLAIGCQDGKIRLWSPYEWRTLETLDTGSTKEVQQLLLLPLQSSPSTAAVATTTCFLASATVDGHMVTWKVSPTGDCAKVPGTIDIRDTFRAFDTSAGFCEFKFHEHQETATATTKDGTVFFFDLTSLLRQSKQMTLTSILPAPKLPGAVVLAGSRKGAFTLVSLAPSNSTLVLSEIVTKGRAVSKDNLPANYLEMAVSTSFETRDLRSSASQTALKKYKLLSLTTTLRDPELVCCVTSFGVFALRVTCLASPKSVMIPRGAEKSPIVLHPGPARATLRFYGEETSTKQEDYRLQCGGDAPNDRLRTPLLQPCPANSMFFSALLPASTHLEIVQMDSELRNQKSINMHAVFSGNAISIAWHATLPQFAVLVPHEPNARRLTRAVSNINTPRRRGFMFGGKSGSSDEITAAAEAKSKSALARSMALSVYEITADGHAQSVKDNCSCGDDRLLHVFSGPVLGVAKFEAGDDDVVGGPSTSFVGAEGLRDSPSMRNKRTESSIFSPTSGGGSASSFSAFDNECSELKRTTLEFFEWGASGAGALKRIGTAIECPLLLEWERATHRFCALAYARCVRIYRVTAPPVAEVVCLHELPTAQPATALKWMHHTLFITTEDDVKCFVMSKMRVFPFELASRFVVDDGSSLRRSADMLTFPKRQAFRTQFTTILGFSNQSLVLAGPVQSIQLLELKNKVLQCCILVSVGQADLAAQVASVLSKELGDWLASVFEAFAFVRHAFELPNVSLAFKVNIAIKHSMIDELLQLIKASPGAFPESRDLTGASLCQRACTRLHRSGRDDELRGLVPELIRGRRDHDAIFAAQLIQDDLLLAQALSAAESWGGAFHATKRSGPAGAPAATEALGKWNAALTRVTAPWKTTLEAHGIRPPETITIVQS